MKATLVPTTSDVLKAIGDGMERVILPALTTLAERSAGTTLRHLLRYASVRVDAEGQVLFDERGKLHSLLADAASYLDTAADARATPLAAAIRASLTAERDPGVYLSVVLLAQDVAALRQHVTDVLLILQAGEQTEPATTLRTALRDYIAWQLAQDAKIIEPSFRGHGMRR